jgi:hypothetical protein
MAASALAMKDALDEGYRVGVAQAMPMGVLLCDRMGFKEFYRIQPHILETV